MHRLPALVDTAQFGLAHVGPAHVGLAAADPTKFNPWEAFGDVYGLVAPFFPIAIAGTIVWGLWLYRFVMSHRAKAIVSDFRATTSVIVPSFHEDPAILLDCLQSWRAQSPTEIIIVLDVADLSAYRRIVALGDRRVRPILFHHVGKRSALGAGIRAATGDLLVLTDSDTWWRDDLLVNVQMPFVDPLVGAVGTHQNVNRRSTSVWRRIADWLVDIRYLDYVPAMGAVGAVPCVSGRTAVYRREAVLPVLEYMEDEFFMGRRCVSGDDGRLTWLVLASGYKTVHQSSAHALSMFPASFRAFIKQRVRWSRNSYRCYLTAMAKGWLWRVPFITKVTVLQFLLTPLTMGFTMFYLLFSRLEVTIAGTAAALAWLLLGRGIRGISHLRRRPKDIVLLPLVAFTVILVALPIKLYALVTMNRQGWLTRSDVQIGGDAQDFRSLKVGPPTGSAASAPGVPTPSALPAAPGAPGSAPAPAGTRVPAHRSEVPIRAQP